MEINPWLIGALGMGAVLLIFVGLARVVSARRTMSDRFQNFVWRSRSAAEVAQSAAATPGVLTRGVEQALARGGRTNDLTRDLARAGILLTPGEFVILNFTCLLATFGLALITFRVWYVALPLSLLGYFAPRFYVRVRQSRREAAFSAQLPNALNLISSSMRTGYSLLQALDLLSKEMQPPASEEFGRVVREMGLGVGIETALDNMLRRMQNTDLELIVTAILIQSKMGGNLSLILDKISHTIRERVRIKGEISILTAQQQLSGYVVGALPFALSILLFLINPSYMRQSFNALCGQSMFFAAFLLVGLAFILIRRIVALEV